MTEPNALTIAEARGRLRAGDLSAADLTEACIAAAEAAGALNAVVHPTYEIARERAAAADERLARGDAPDLCGIPLGIKDLFCTQGVPSQAGSRILEGFRPPYESTVTRRLRDQGAVMIGKLNMDEFAMGSSNETSTYGDVVSPWRGAEDAPLTPGGSSGGSAAAVAADLVLGATGTDTGGSIRQPAAFTGIVGMKPTYGRCSRWGIVAFASSLDQAGPMTRTVRDAAILGRAMMGHDPMDSTSADREVPDFEAMLDAGVAGKRDRHPARVPDGRHARRDRGALGRGRRHAARRGRRRRATSRLPHTKYALPAYYVIAPAEASSNLARYDGVRYGRRAETAPGEGVTEMYERTRAEGFGDEVKRRVMVGTYVLSAGFYDAYYNRARRVRTLIARDFEEAFASGVDAILTPATPSAAFPLGSASDDPVQMYLNDVFTVTVNLAGLPGISVPAGLDAAGLPLGLQLVGRPWEEGEMLAAAQAIEDRAGFVAKPARWW